MARSSRRDTAAGSPEAGRRPSPRPGAPPPRVLQRDGEPPLWQTYSDSRSPAFHPGVMNRTRVESASGRQRTSTIRLAASARNSKSNAGHKTPILWQYRLQQGGAVRQSSYLEIVLIPILPFDLDVKIRPVGRVVDNLERITGNLPVMGC